MAPIRLVVGVVLAFTLLVFLPGCGSYGSQLRDEEEIPDLAVLGRRADGLKKSLHYPRSDATAEAPLTVAVHEYPGDEDTRAIIAVHGILSNHETWRYLIGALDGEFEVWAVDMPGSGWSAAPPPKGSSDEAYSPDWLARHVLEAVKKRLAKRPNVDHLTLLCHSLGGGVGLRILGSKEIRAEYPDVIARIDGAVLLSPLEFGLENPKEELVKLANVDDVSVWIGVAIREIDRISAETAWASFVNSDRVPYECFTQFYDILSDPIRRHAAQAMLLQAIPLVPGEQAIDRDAVKVLQEDYRNIDVPCLILWGIEDDTLPKACGSVIAGRNTANVRLKEIEGSKHSLHVEYPSFTADRIRDHIAYGIDPESPLVETVPVPEILTVRGKGPGGPRRIDRTDSISSGRDRPAKTAPSTVSILSGEEVVRSGVRFLSDAFRMFPGVEVQRMSPTESAVAIRGYLDTSAAAQGVLGFVDGRQVYNPFLGNVLWDQLAVRLEDVNQVEVVRGPASFLYGPNAMHGALSIRTKAPLDYEPDSDLATRHAESWGSMQVTAHAGSYGSAVFGTTLVHRTTNTGFKVSAEYDDIEQFDEERDDTRNKAFVDAAYEVRLEGDPDHVLGVACGYSRQDFDLLLPEVEGIPSTHAVSDAQELYARINHRIGRPDDLQVRTQFSWTGYDATTAPLDYYAPFDLEIDTVDIESIVTWALDWQTLTGGAGYRRTSFSTSDNDVADGSHAVDQLWLFAQDEIEITKGLGLTVGARVDTHSETGSSISPRAAVVWEFTGSQFLRASAGRGFRYPSLRELWFDMPVTNVPGAPGAVTVLGNEDLDPECLTSYELGWFGFWGRQVDVPADQLTKPGESHDFEAGVTVFYNVIDDLISYAADLSDPTDILVRPENQADEITYGTEVEARYGFAASFSAFGNYSYAVREDRETGNRNLIAPLHKFTAGVAWQKYGFDAMLWANYFGSSEMAGQSLDSYIGINGSIGYTFRTARSAEGRAFLRFYNLLNDEHREHPQGDEFGLIVTGGLEFDW